MYISTNQTEKEDIIEEDKDMIIRDIIILVA